MSKQEDKVPIPNYTQVPNFFIDNFLPHLNGSESKIYIAICRKTIGWHKTCDSISLSQLNKLTGIESATCVEALKTLEKLELVSIERCPGKTSKIDLNLSTSSESEEVPLRKVKSTSSESEDTKETLINKREKRKIRKKDNIAATAAIVKSDTTFYHRIEQGFLHHNGEKFTDYGKEGKAIHQLIAKAEARDKEHSEDLLVSVCAAFWKLKEGTDKFWRGQPFTPSALNAGSIWDRVLESMRCDELDPVVEKMIRGET